MDYFNNNFNSQHRTETFSLYFEIKCALNFVLCLLYYSFALTLKGLFLRLKTLHYDRMCYMAAALLVALLLKYAT